MSDYIKPEEIPNNMGGGISTAGLKNAGYIKAVGLRSC